MTKRNLVLQVVLLSKILSLDFPIFNIKNRFLDLYINIDKVVKLLVLQLE